MSSFRSCPVPEGLPQDKRRATCYTMCYHMTAEVGTQKTHLLEAPPSSFFRVGGDVSFSAISDEVDAEFPLGKMQLLHQPLTKEKRKP